TDLRVSVTVPVGGQQKAGAEQAPASPAATTPTALPTEPDGSSAVPIGVQPSWPCQGCGAAVPMTDAACTACGSPFLGGLRAAAPTLRLPVVGDITAYGQRGRLLLGGVLGVAIAAVIVILAALVG